MRITIVPDKYLQALFSRAEARTMFIFLILIRMSRCTLSDATFHVVWNALRLEDHHAPTSQWPILDLEGFKVDEAHIYTHTHITELNVLPGVFGFHFRGGEKEKCVIKMINSTALIVIKKRRQKFIFILFNFLPHAIKNHFQHFFSNESLVPFLPLFRSS